MVAASATMSAAMAADGYGTLVFTSVSGESYSVATQGLEIYFKDGNLTFNNDERSIPVASLVSMEFVDDQGNVGVDQIIANSTGAVTVYTLDGVKTGDYASLPDAADSLQPGLYVVCHSNGNTFKIKIGK